MKSPAVKLTFILFCLSGFLIAQQVKQIAPQEGWYVNCDSVYHDAFRIGPGNNFERYSGTRDCNSTEKGCWKTHNDSLILIPLWSYDYCPHPLISICMTGVPTIPYPRYLKMTADTFYLNYGPYDNDSDRFVFLTNETGTPGVHMNALRRIFPEINSSPIQVSVQSPAGYYNWSHTRGVSLFSLNEDGTFSFKDEQYGKAIKIYGQWTASADTILCRVTKRSGSDSNWFEDEMLFFVWNGKLVSSKPEADEISVGRVYYPESQKQFNYYWKHD